MGYVSTLERHRIDSDGNGIRTLICLYGCTLRCKYCPNRFAIEGEEDVQSLYRSADDLLHEVMVDDIYFRATGGGVTFGGGEPLMQAEFIKEFIEKAPKSWSFNIETSLAVPFDNIKAVAGLIDTFYIDIKAYHRAAYKKYTGKYAPRMTYKLKKLLKIVPAKKIIIRIPEIKGFVDKKAQELAEQKLRKIGFTQFDKFTYITNF